MCAVRYKQVSLKFLIINFMFYCKVAWGWPRSQVTIDKDKKWGLPTWDIHIHKTYTFMLYLSINEEV